MSGPVREDTDTTATPERDRPAPACVEISDSREAHLGEVRIRRALPRRGRRTVGAWCFADHMGPADVTPERSLDVGPHPHIGLQTVTWLTDGQLLHRDSLGSEQVIAPGQLNLMTSGGSVTHSEEATGHYGGTLEGIQLWVALPEATRHGDAEFEHHAELPQLDLDGAQATVLLGEFEGGTSPGRRDTELVGVDLVMHSPTTVPLRPEFEYGLVVLSGSVAVDGQALTPGHLGYLGRGRDELGVDVREPARVMLIGGVPFEERILMWWNFVARSREEIEEAQASWARRDDRFARVASPLDRIPAPTPFWQKTGR